MKLTFLIVLIISSTLLAQDKYDIPIFGKPFYKNSYCNQWDYINYSPEENYEGVKPNKKEVSVENKNFLNNTIASGNNDTKQKKDITPKTLLFKQSTYTNNFSMPIFGKPFYRGSLDNQWEYVSYSQNESFQLFETKNQKVSVENKTIPKKIISENDEL